MNTLAPRAAAAALAALALAAFLPAAGGAEPAPAVRVAFLGDSMMKLLGHQGEREMGKLPGVAVVTNYTSLGSGLARLDAFNWMAKFESVVAEAKPTLAVVALGTNDRQPMEKADGTVVRPGEPGWDEEYGRRTAQALDLLAAGGARIYWLELPDMQDAVRQADADAVNALFRKACAGRAGVTFFETRPFLSRKPGEYTKFKIGPGGKPIELRSADGIHLSRAGADLLIEKLIAAALAKP